MKFEAALMTFHKESDESIAFKSFVQANSMAKKLNKEAMCSESDLRMMMKLYLDAFWVYNDMRNDLSYNIHEIGKILEREYQCQYLFDVDRNKYYSSCPALLLHNDFGFSFRGSEKYKCSICGLPIMECEHISGEFYDDVVCKEIEGRCNICGEEKCKKHIEGEKYNHVEAVKIVYDVKLVTFDMVEEPEMRFARVSKIYLPEDMVIDGIEEEDKETFVYGKSKLYCHHCSQCTGYVPNRFHHLFNRGEDETKS